MRAVLCALLAALAARAAEREPRGAPRCRHERCRCIGYVFPYSGELHYEIDGRIISFEKTHAADLKMNCYGASVLDSFALPCYSTALSVSSLEFKDCPPPGAGSLADTLAALNVTLEYSLLGALEEPRSTLTIWFNVALELLAAKHFVGLKGLANLNVYNSYNKWTIGECSFLAPLQNLRSLEMMNVVPTCELDVPPSLRRLVLNSYNMTQLPVTPTLELFALYDWMEPRLAPLGRCDSLRQLFLLNPMMIALPKDWLVNCSRLEVLYITKALFLTTLPPNLFFSNKALKKLSVTTSAIETLPTELLMYSPHLNSLDLSNNRIKRLPSCMFDVARRMQELDLSSNELESSAIDALGPLVELTVLNLSYNPLLVNICGTNGYSPIRNSRKLRELLLRGTGVSRICRDWRQDMTQLETLDLNQTKVIELSFQDLQFTRTVEATVIWQLDASVTVMPMTREHYNTAALGMSSRVHVLLHQLAPVECDCSMYWTRRALDLSQPALQLFNYLFCTDGRWLRDVPPEDMVCARPEECKAPELAACTCTMWADDDPDHESMVRVHCKHAGLYHIPHLRSRDNSTKRIYELLLAGNHISDLHADDLKNDIKGLDLRNNSLKSVDEVTAKRLGDIDGMLRLAGNPFDCSCRAAPLLRALRARNTTQTDLYITCSNGSLMHLTPIEDCLPDAPSPVSLGTWFAIVLGVLLVIVLSAVLSLASRERRFFVQAVLHRWGIVWRATEPAEDECRRYDAFVTFSHKDEALVPELIARLEPTYRLCVHYRDWIPGCFISEQVVESVRESRRTIALVSRHFLASSWACAEFREAHTAAMLDARSRLIVVLLEEPAALLMDDLLRRYVKTHTYLRWGEPWFWDKLSVALPRPRVPRAPEPAPPASPPARALKN